MDMYGFYLNYCNSHLLIWVFEIVVLLCNLNYPRILNVTHTGFNLMAISYLRFTSTRITGVTDQIVAILN